MNLMRQLEYWNDGLEWWPVLGTVEELLKGAEPLTELTWLCWKLSEKIVHEI